MRNTITAIIIGAIILSASCGASASFFGTDDSSTGDKQQAAVEKAPDPAPKFKEGDTVKWSPAGEVCLIFSADGQPEYFYTATCVEGGLNVTRDHIPETQLREYVQ